MQKKVYIIDDDKFYTNLLSNISQKIGFDSESSNSVEDVDLELVRASDVLVLDIVMPGIDGVEFLSELSLQPGMPDLILVSGAARGVVDSVLKLASSLGMKVRGVLKKPFQFYEYQNLLEVNDRYVSEHLYQSTVGICSENEISAGLNSREFTVHYQPKLRLIDNAWVGNEALARWNKSGAVLPPDSFIAVVESSQEIAARFTEVIIERAISNLSRIWGIAGHRTSVSVNFPPLLMRDLDFPSRVTDLCAQYGISPGMVIIELTENSLVDMDFKYFKNISRLKLAGFRLSVDDFGIGYSNFRRIHDDLFDEIKIDKSFVGNLLSSSGSQKIVASVIELSAKLGISSVAEGVEDQQSYDWLKMNGCEQVQGYYVGRPMPVDNLQAWFSESSLIEKAGVV